MHACLVKKERERESLLPHLKWRGTLLPQSCRSLMALLTSKSATNLGVKAGHKHSKWNTFTCSQHTGDAACPNTNPWHEFITTSLSFLHWLGNNSKPSAAATTTIIPNNTIHRPQLRLPVLSVCIIISPSTNPPQPTFIHLWPRSTRKFVL